ncbi:hypothetical protein VIGAN_04191500 [Vigna angularis var. angularis]|uniref:Aldehyde dehydrogenase domain-containing protein n=1 Tax=Vigna angularis var. angularis TaxID=157739 RepID=A0A0S3RV69_PHAAN|nr:hypothetical protein VIGAN_04191500 [Vigna angularis var. angularis]
MAKQIIRDAKTDYPAACNAMETLLVHEDLSSNGGLVELVAELQREGVKVYGGPRASALLNISGTNSYHLEYSSLACTVEIVDDVYAAIDHIHQHGSAHTECIVAEDCEVAEAFLNQVDSAAVFHNASTRFCDGARFGLGAEVMYFPSAYSNNSGIVIHILSCIPGFIVDQVGISTSRIHARGPVGVEGLLTNRWILRGSGHVVNGDRGITYTHKNLPVKA